MGVDNSIKLHHFAYNWWSINNYPIVKGMELIGASHAHHKHSGKSFIQTVTGVVILHSDGTREFIRNSFYDGMYLKPKA